MEHLDYSKILEKIGPEKDMSRLTEEEWLFYDMVRAIQSRSADDEKQIIQQAIKQLKNQQFKLHTNQNRINMKSSNKTWIGIAAGVAILVVAYFFLWSPTKTNDQIFSENFKTSSDYISTAKENAMNFGMAGTGTSTRDSFLMAIEFFEKNQWDEAIKILVPYMESYPTNSDARYLLSKAQMNREKYAPALANLSILNATKDLDVILLDEVKWYYALGSLKMVDGRKQAKILFEQLVALGGNHATLAKANLELMK